MYNPIVPVIAVYYIQYRNGKYEKIDLEAWYI